MISSLSLFIGGRFSRAKQRNKMVSFISLSSTIGIMVGVAVIIIGLSAMNGFERELENRVLAVVPHGDFTAVNKLSRIGSRWWNTSRTNQKPKRQLPLLSSLLLRKKGLNSKRFRYVA